MKKCYLQKVVQNKTTFYTMVEDPRIIVEMIPRVNEKEVQEFQRPWLKARVREISEYVAGKMPVKGDAGGEYKAKGLIPNSPILNVKDAARLPLNKDKDGRVYLELPTTKEEYERFRESIEVIDGQHRIRAFSEEFRSQYLKDEDEYQMIFALFYQATRDLKNELFMVTNEKQKAVEANLLRWFRKELNLLGEDAEIYDFVVDMLDGEDSSPLHGRIIVGAEQIKKGYKETQLEKILQKYRIWESLCKLASRMDNPKEAMFNAISNYLRAWEKVCEISFQEPEGTATKISGLRYILCLLPDIIEILVAERKTTTVENFETIIRSIPAAVADPDIKEVPDIFVIKNADFRGEGATVALAKHHGVLLGQYRSSRQNTFNPLATD